ncbi:MAG TPA: tripartite tricarboxylate transporter substrate-binding protein [Xanthobacteraceae bacterium]|nr:tripartite tricarboxylate transporter substrate-binding protein [Xanthobacteraceae bacterium]
MKKTAGLSAMLFCALLLAWAPGARAAGYPDHPVKIIVPFSAGGITDVVARLIAQHLSERLGQQFYVDDIGGAGGNIGMGNAARARGDGYTLLFASSSIVVNPSLYKTIPYDIDKDFIPISKIGGTPNSWLVNNDFPAQTMHDLVALLKANPGKYSVASPGSGTTASLSIEMLKQDLGLDFVVVPFAGGGPLNESVLAGFTPIGCSAYGNTAPVILAGKVHTLAVASKTRLQALPNVPTLEEEGIKGEEAETMAGALAPAGTPAPIVELLQKQIAEIVRTPEVQHKLLSFGIVPDGGSSADFAAYLKAEVAKWKRVIEVGKIDKI